MLNEILTQIQSQASGESVAFKDRTWCWEKGVLVRG